MLLHEMNNYVDGRVQYNDTLNPKLYDDNNDMLPEVQEALMNVTENFLNDLDLPDMVVHDVVVTGSAASYNWTKYSDVDLHIISDVDVFADPHMAAKYFNAAKNVWNNKHDVDIRGIEVEVYVEDNDMVNYGATSKGIGRYSVMDDEWIREPIHDVPTFDENAVNCKVKAIMRQIDGYLEGEDDIEGRLHLKEKIWFMRGEGLQREGEYSVENLTFKVLRNLGYTDKILKVLHDVEDNEMSIEEEVPTEDNINGIQEMQISEIEERQLPSANQVLKDITQMLEGIKEKYSHAETDNTSSPSGPNTQTFRADHSGKLKVASNVTLHGYAGFQQNLIVALQIGSAMGYPTVGRIQDEAKAGFREILRDYGQEGIELKVKNGAGEGGPNIGSFYWVDKDGSNYSTSGAAFVDNLREVAPNFASDEKPTAKKAAPTSKKPVDKEKRTSAKSDARGMRGNSQSMGGGRFS